MNKLDSIFLRELESINKAGYFSKYSNPDKSPYRINSTKYLRANEKERLWMDENVDLILDKYKNGVDSMLNIEGLLSTIKSVLIFFFVLTVISIIGYFILIILNIV
tara:strand:+ start:963 stop:1280 length:318 start_codon:yes stop_codon:yes gene_type:complete